MHSLSRILQQIVEKASNYLCKERSILRPRQPGFYTFYIRRRKLPPLEGEFSHSCQRARALRIEFIVVVAQSMRIASELHSLVGCAE